MEAETSDFEGLRRAHEELARRVTAERLAFADRVQEELDQAQHLQLELDLRDEQIRQLEDGAAALRARIEELHGELLEAHASHKAVIESRSFRYTRPLRGLGRALRLP
jgi:cell division septum initiation protein DivIVA